MPRIITIDRIDTLPDALKGGFVAIGNFDGVHRGHQSVLERAISAAKAANAPAVALTFEPHPRSMFRPDEPLFRLTPPDMKARLMRSFGMDATICLNFDAALSSLTADEFLDRVLVAGLKARGLVAGYDFHFGKGRSGSPAMLQAAGPARGFAVDIVQAMRDEGGQDLSSSAIRVFLEAGDIAAANAALGWRWRVVAEVVHGDKRGRVLGFPTANMVLPPEVKLKQGVYAVRARIDGIWFSGAANYGRRIQFGNGPVLLETHVLDYTGDLYGKRIEIEFCGFLRPEAKFDSINALVEQMGLDCDTAREIISATLRGPRGLLQAALED